MLSYETIKRDMIWIAIMDEHAEVGTYEQVGHLEEDERCKSFMTANWKHQPEHLQKFFKDYVEQWDKPNEEQFWLLKDFYDEWNFKNEMN